METQDFWVSVIFLSMQLGRFDGTDVQTVAVTIKESLSVESHPYVTRPSYKAAVYEHAVVLPIPFLWKSRKEALKLMNKNLDIYEEQVIAASLQGAHIIVFPEDGIYGPIFNRNSIEPFLEYIPDPKLDDWNPCLQWRRHPDTEVQYRLSCLARYNSIYVVANMGNRQSCNHSDPKCPDDGRYQFNTNVVYDPDGMLIARYNKHNLFGESQFNIPPLTEEIYFDTPFGRFGTFTCFDVLFRTPAVDLIERHGIDSVVFPTAWMDALPLLAAIQYHSAFAVMMNVNFLAANLHIPLLRFGGSGIYTPTGPNTFYRNETTFKGRLLVTTVPSTYRALANKVLSPGSTCTQLDQVEDRRNVSFNSTCPEFQSVVFHDLYDFIWLESHSGHVRVCQRAVCCHLNYAMLDSGIVNGTSGHYALGAFDGLHVHDGRYYLQVCTLLRCANALRRSCGDPVKFSSTYFDFISLRGEFQTPYISPEILIMDSKGGLALPYCCWHYYDGNIASPSGFTRPLVSLNLFGRWYEKDDTTALRINVITITLSIVSQFL